VAEQVRGDAAAGPERGADGVPGAGEPGGWAVRQAPAAVDEVSRWERQRREVGRQRAQPRPVMIGDVVFGQGDGGGLAVHGQHCPAPAEELGGVSAIAAAQIDREASPCPDACRRSRTAAACRHSA
jgi:hypothetical protein